MLGGNKVTEQIVATFSIVACDPNTKEWGVAVQSRFLAVGSVVPWAKAGVGAIATQSYANTTFGPKGLELLAQGKSAQEVLNILIESDPERDKRQVGIVDAQGNVANYTGEGCFDWAGGVTGPNFTVQGNILVSEETVQAMAKTFIESEGSLAHRLLEALEAGQAAGGDSRGQQSAALFVVQEGAGYGGFNDVKIDLRVDDHKEPISELKRIYQVHQALFAKRG
ncbi:MAG: DUF1028 domain-containing protein [Firmicutes bacterium]|nr:DUF1028 domain-containing protein [Bacillota bacterium]